MFMGQRKPVTTIPAAVAPMAERTRSAPGGTYSSEDRAQGSLVERLRTAEAAMYHAARLAMVGQMTAVIIHEVNNPLASIEIALHLLTRLGPDHPHHGQIIGLLQDEVSRLSTIATQMRDLSHQDEAGQSACNLGGLLTQTLALAELRLLGTRVSLAFIPPPSPTMVIANVIQLRQLFLNLIVNAIDAMPAGGVLTVRVLPQATTVVVEVQDVGGGIPLDIRSRLFEPFVTSKPSGSGLGLYISAQIAADHGGWIEVQSTEGDGSVFRVVLPLLRAP
jgi:signal transduction histidine kinase